jgi:hypothetical protein
VCVFTIPFSLHEICPIFCRIGSFFIFPTRIWLKQLHHCLFWQGQPRSWPSPHCGGRAISVAVIAAIIHPTCGLVKSVIWSLWRNYMRLSTNLICQWTWAHWWVWWELLVSDVYAFCLHYPQKLQPIHEAKNGLTKLKKPPLWTIILLPFGPKMGHSFENTINEPFLHHGTKNGPKFSKYH